MANANPNIQEAVGRNTPFVPVQSPPIIGQSAPTSSNTNFAKGSMWIDESTSPSSMYFHLGGGDWDNNNLSLSTDATFAGALDTTASSSLAIKTYADGLAIAGAPNASTTVKGIAELCTTAEAVAGADTTRIMTSDNVASVFAAPPALGSGTPAAGSFSTLAASGLASLSGSATILSGGTALNLGSDASADAINIGTGAAARTITMGNITGATALALNAGTGGIALASTGTGDITINSDDTLLLDSDGVLDLNSSGAAINIGNDANAFAINLGTGAAARTITLGNSTGATSLVLDCGTGALNIGTNAIAHTVTLGNVTGATAIRLNCGTGDFALEGATTSTYDISSTGINTGTCTFASGTGARTVELAGGGTGIKTINIGAAATADVITIGSTTGAGSLALMAGSGDVNVSGNLVLADVATQLEMNGGAATDFIGQGTLVAGTVTILNTNIAAGDRILITRSALNASPALGDFITTINAGVSFVVGSYDAVGSLETTDVSAFDYFIVRQN